MGHHRAKIRRTSRASLLMKIDKISIAGARPFTQTTSREFSRYRIYIQSDLV